MISDPVLLAIIGVVIALIAAIPPMVVLLLNNSQARNLKAAEAEILRAAKAAEIEARRAEKLEDWARLDAVAAKAEAATAAQAAKADEAAKLLVVSNEKVAEIARETARVSLGKLEVIHTLVNSQLTAAMQSEYDAITREVALMRRIAGREPDAEAAEAITLATAKLADLRATLDERQKQAKVVENQAKAQAKDVAGPSMAENTASIATDTATIAAVAVESTGKKP